VAGVRPPMVALVVGGELLMVIGLWAVVPMKGVTV
jgi:hypothetical protein